MLRAVLDPGVMIAAAITPDGLCGLVLRAVLAGRSAILVCPALLAELEEVLLRAKFRRYLSEAEARRFVALIAGIAERHPDPAVQVGLTADPDDDYLPSLAQVAGADYPVSGDPHLTRATGLYPPVLTPRQFLQRLA